MHCLPATILGSGCQSTPSQQTHQSGPGSQLPRGTACASRPTTDCSTHRQPNPMACCRNFGPSCSPMRLNSPRDPQSPDALRMLPCDAPPVHGRIRWSVSQDGNRCQSRRTWMGSGHLFHQATPRSWQSPMDALNPGGNITAGGADNAAPPDPPSAHRVSGKRICKILRILFNEPNGAEAASIRRLFNPSRVNPTTAGWRRPPPGAGSPPTTAPTRHRPEAAEPGPP